MGNKPSDKDQLIQELPSSPGVYFFKGAGNEILYVGKAADLKKRVSSHFQKTLDNRHQIMITLIDDIEWQTTDSVIEALILEANLVKKYQPRFNVQLKDDKSFLSVCISNETFPRVYPCRPLSQKQSLGTKIYGPYTSARSLRRALDIIRRLIPYRNCTDIKFVRYKRLGRPCLYYYIKRCSAPCVGYVNSQEYKKTIRHLEWMLQGKKERFIAELGREMKRLAKGELFEKALIVREKIKNLRHIRETALIIEPEEVEEKFIEEGPFHRIEGFDISNISGEHAVGSMVVIERGRLDKGSYRKFRIKTVKQINDIEMLKEILRRRFGHVEWQYPDLIVIDGGVGQLNGAKETLGELGLYIPIIAIAKGANRKKDFFHFSDPLIAKTPDIGRLAILARDEAHRFAISYYRLRHRKALTGN